MKTKNGVVYRTIVDASGMLGVSSDTIRRYIRSSFLPPPKRVFFGKTSVAIFTDEYIEKAKSKLASSRGGPRI